MKRSTDHILTTHTGSLPRPTDPVDVVLRKEEKQPVDEKVLAMRVRGVPKRPACTGPISWKDRDAVPKDIENHARVSP